MSEETSDILVPPQEKGVEEMANVGCDYCGRARALEMPWEEPMMGRPGDAVRGVYICSYCQKPSPFELKEQTVTFRPGGRMVVPLGPAAIDAVRQRYHEAELCWYASANRAAAVMARAAVEEGLKSRGLTKGKLEEKINEALNQGIIGQEEQAIAHGSRLIGNSAVHEAEQIAPGQVPAVLSAAASIINHLFP